MQGPRDVHLERCSASPLVVLSSVPLPQPQRHREGQVDPMLEAAGLAHPSKH